jgi:hypothetical protein
MRSRNFQNEDGCILWIAADGLHYGVDVPGESFLGLHLQLCEFSRGHGGPRHRYTLNTEGETDDVCLGLSTTTALEVPGCVKISMNKNTPRAVGWLRADRPCVTS